MKIRISRTPEEREVDGVRLDRLRPGAIREMSATLASWLIVEGYAEPEMRRAPRDTVDLFGGGDQMAFADDRRRKS